jgi:hypothetical protein
MLLIAHVNALVDLASAQLETGSAPTKNRPRVRSSTVSSEGEDGLHRESERDFGC